MSDENVNGVPSGGALKRVADLLLCLAGTPIILPVGVLLTLLILLDSRGSALYSQERLGFGGKKFKLYKFRTMVANAEAVLPEYLRDNPERASEWSGNRKLKQDPRLTRIGAFLRKTSLDELPQILNVLKGDMSLIGPRPIVEEEKAKYGRSFRSYCRARPGISGLWQVSGRNNTTYHRRVACDRLYVSGWSPALDTWIFLKTIPVAVGGNGAY